MIDKEIEIRNKYPFEEFSTMYSFLVFCQIIEDDEFYFSIQYAYDEFIDFLLTKK